MLLHVSDVTSPTAAEQQAQVEEVLRELESQDKPRLYVMNKVDLLPEKKRESLRDTDSVVHVSAAKGIGLDKLLERIDDADRGRSGAARTSARTAVGGQGAGDARRQGGRSFAQVSRRLCRSRCASSGVGAAANEDFPGRLNGAYPYTIATLASACSWA